MVNLCAEGEKVIVERLGRFHAVHEAGWFFSLPIVDRLAYVVDMRERQLEVALESGAPTKDHVVVLASGTLWITLADAYKAAYGSSNPFTAVRHQAQLALRTAVGEFALDDLSEGRQLVGDRVVEALRDSTAPFGVEVRGFAVADVSPENRLVSEAMATLAVTRRQQEHVRAESEGAADAAKLKAEAIGFEAKANADAVREIAQANADALRLRAAAAADAISTVARVLRTDADRDAAKFVLAQDHIHQASAHAFKFDGFPIDQPNAAHRDRTSFLPPDPLPLDKDAPHGPTPDDAQQRHPQ